MLLDLILIFLIAVGLAGLVFLLIRKIPVLRLTNPAEVGKFEQEQLRHQLIFNRLKRQWRKLKDRLRLLLKHPLKRRQENQSIIQKLGDWEEFLKRTLNEQSSPQRTLNDYLALADEALKNENWSAAEEAYLEVLKIDPHNWLAYQGLGEVYLEQRDFEAAREIYEFLLKRGRAAVSSLGLARVASGQGRLEEARAEYLGAIQLTTSAQPRLELAQILCELGDYQGALKYLKEARQIEPQNPKILDFYIEVSILNGQPAQAREGLEALKHANPENQKIAELARLIRELEQKQKFQKLKSRPRKRSTTFGLSTNRR